MPRLRVTRGPLAGRRIEVEGELRIGRQGDGLVIDDEELSREHVSVRSVPGALEVEDLGSTNGTFVDDRRVHTPTRVGDGAVVRVGATVFEVEGVGPRPTRQAAQPTQHRRRPAAPGLFSSLARIPTGRRSKVLVIVAWVVIFAVSGRNSVNLGDIQTGNPADIIPKSAQATQAREASVRFPAGRLTPAAVVYRRDGGLTAADRDRVSSDRSALRGVKGVGAVDEAIFSDDGTTALVMARVNQKPPGVTDSVEAIRKLVGRGGAGPTVEVTGPAGFTVDASDVLGSIDATLFVATLILVLVLLIVIYRSPVFWIIPLLAIVVAVVTSRGLAYFLGEQGVIISPQGTGVMTVLVFGVGTDYALLLVARFREQLGLHDDRHQAAAEALRRAATAIIPSGLIVIAALLCLEVAEVKGTSGLGAIGAAAVAAALLAMLTLLPALLCCFGRRAFWPAVPRAGADRAPTTRGAWERIAERVGASPRMLWIAPLLLLAVMAIGLIDLNSSLTLGKGFRNDVEAVEGQRLVARAFAPGASSPAYVIVDESRAADALSEVESSPAVASVGPLDRSRGSARFELALAHDPYSEAGFRDIEAVRGAARKAGGSTALVGGPTAEEKDLRTAQARDNRLIIPIVLAVVLVLLGVVLRALVAALVLLATVVASFAATLGIASLAFDRAFGFAGMDPSLPLLSFTLLIALGIDYNIFLMTRVRAEAESRGTRAGTIHGLGATGAVITSAGVVLAGTFCMLAILPLVSLTEIGLTIAFGALLDTFLVRSLLVPALVLDIGPRTWWPSSLAREERARADA